MSVYDGVHQYKVCVVSECVSVCMMVCVCVYECWCGV